MNIFIIHGNDTEKCYKRFLLYIKRAKDKNLELFYLDKNLKNIDTVFSTNSLFTKKSLIICENTNILNKNIILWIKKHKDTITSDLLIYNPSQLTKSYISVLPNVKKIEEYNLPKLIWSFLDGLFPGNSKNCLLLLDKIIKNEPIEKIFSLLSKHFIDIYRVKFAPESLPYPPWRISKLKRQSMHFKNDKLPEMIEYLSEIDIKVKTSKGQLIDLLDFFIIKYLK